MSGHSKWATTKHKKAVIDAKRGKLFAKMIKNIEVAARTGGADVSGNPTLFDAIQKAKKSSVPNKNIDSAVKRGAGLEAGGADYETIMYEGYGPNGVAVLIECLTDNRNRAASDVRVAMTRNGGNMAAPGSVSYLFNRKGVVVVPKGELSEDDVLGAVLDAGAEEVNDLGESFEVVSEATDLVAVRTALQDAGIDSADANFVPTMQVELDEDGARKIFKLIDALEDSDDVQNVFANFDVEPLATGGVGVRVQGLGGRRAARTSAVATTQQRSFALHFLKPMLAFIVQAGHDGPGRGSAGGPVVAYARSTTHFNRSPMSVPRIAPQAQGRQGQVRGERGREGGAGPPHREDRGLRQEDLPEVGVGAAETGHGLRLSPHAARS
jgi:YebC/PmpR family DNA-binding regulatory protein